ncbi:MAG: hypothetical protein K9H64_17500 [Bacteroidales bacterium]|nr:hypothetical protein [Bacteroidales bacterium]MCF8457756.1 hypothetical protein [Bacteroidales bacterium]
MKEDILEQLVDGYFLRQPSTFTKHNIKFKPSQSDIFSLDNKEKSKYSVSSDIDVIAVHLNKEGLEKVSVISCKSWQDGFDIDFFFDHLTDPSKRDKKVGTGSAWKKFRELVEPIWAKAFRDAIKRETLSSDFTYYIAVTKLKTNKDKKIDDFKNCKLFIDNLSDNGKNKVQIEFLELETMLKQIFNEKKNTTIEATEIGRFIQLIKATGMKWK